MYSNFHSYMYYIFIFLYIQLIFQNVLLPIPTPTTTEITVVKQTRRRKTILKIKVASVTAVCFRKTVCVARETSTYLVQVEPVRATNSKD